MSDFSNSNSYTPRQLSGAWTARCTHLLANRPNSLQLSINERDATLIAQRMSYEHFRPGDRIRLGRGASNTSRYLLILHGEVTSRAVNHTDTSVAVISTVGPGASLGKIDMFGGLPNIVVGTVNEELHCASMTKEQLRALVEDEPAVASRFLLMMLTELAMHSADAVKRSVVMGQMLRSLEEQLQDEVLRHSAHRSDIQDTLGANPIPRQRDQVSSRPVSTVTQR